MPGDHAVYHCRCQCLEICGNLGSSGSERGTKNEMILWREMECCMTMVVYHEMQKTGHCLLHKSRSVNRARSQTNCQISDPLDRILLIWLQSYIYKVIRMIVGVLTTCQSINQSINQSIVYFPFYLLQVLRKPKDLEIVIQSIYSNINNNNTGLIMG